MDDGIKVSSIMTTNVVTVNENDKLQDIALKLSEHNISGAPVVNAERKLVGIISDSDILHFLNTYDSKTDKNCKLDESESYKLCTQKFGIYTIEPARAVDISKTYENANKKTARDVMVKPVITASITDDIEDVSALMITKKVKRIPIIHEDVIVGIVSRADIVKFVANAKRAKELVGA